MKAVVRAKFGGPEVLSVSEIPKSAPADDQVLVRVRASSINKADWYDLTGPPMMRLLGGGVRRPARQTLGTDIAGTVESAGGAVTQLKAGDEVFGVAKAGYAEYACAREDRVAVKPANMSFEQAAAVPVAGVTALQALRDKGKVAKGQKVLIDGSSGGVGTFALQIAKAFEADVTAVCSTGNLDAARTMGADRVIDYSAEDFTKEGGMYDLIVAVNGYHSILGYRRALRPGGTYVMAGSSKVLRGMLQTFVLGPVISRTGDKKMGFMGIAAVSQKDLTVLKAMMEEGKVVPRIDRRFQLGEISDAFSYFGEGHAKGKVVIAID